MDFLFAPPVCESDVDHTGQTDKGGFLPAWNKDVALLIDPLGGNYFMIWSGLPLRDATRNVRQLQQPASGSLCRQRVERCMLRAVVLVA